MTRTHYSFGARRDCAVRSGPLAAKKAGRTSRDARLLEDGLPGSLCAIRMLMESEMLYESSDLDIMPFAKELLREKEPEDDEVDRLSAGRARCVVEGVRRDRVFARPRSVEDALVLSTVVRSHPFSSYGSIHKES